MPLSKLEQHALNETYENVRKLIHKMVGNFMHVHGTEFGSYDELLSIANERFMKAYYSYDPSKGNPFSTWLAYYIRYSGFIELIRAKSKDKKRTGRVVFDSTILTNEELKIENRITDLMEMMTEDAKAVASFVLTTPADVLRKSANGGGRTGIISVIRRYFIKQGWPAKRVHLAFRQVSKAIEEYDHAA